MIVLILSVKLPHLRPFVRDHLFHANTFPDTLGRRFQEALTVCVQISEQTLSFQIKEKKKTHEILL